MKILQGNKIGGGENMDSKAYAVELLLDILSTIKDEIKKRSGEPEQLCILSNAAAQIGAIIPEGYWINKQNERSAEHE